MAMATMSVSQVVGHLAFSATPRSALLNGFQSRRSSAGWSRERNSKGHVSACPLQFRRAALHCASSRDVTTRRGQSQHVFCCIAERLSPGAVVDGPPSRDSDGELGEVVKLHVYNIDRAGFAAIAATLTKKEMKAVWHVGVAVYGVEYWFDHKIEAAYLQDVAHVRGFGPTYEYEIGRTMKTREELERFLLTRMVKEYNADVYDCFNHNCHHFADDVCIWLTGNGIPQWCLDYGEKCLENLSEEEASKLRWVSNKMARLLMVAWGRFKKGRFDDKQFDIAVHRASLEQGIQVQ